MQTTRNSLKKAGLIAAFTALVSLCAPITIVQAQITYVDATLVNTSQSDGTGGYTTFTPTPETPANGLDNLWRQRTTNPALRTDGGTSPFRFESNDAGTPSEDAPRLRTTVSGLAIGETYDVYAYFWGAPVVFQAWGLSAGLVDLPGTLQHYVGSTGGTQPATTPPPILATEISSLSVFANAGDITVANSDLVSGNQRLMQISLGQVTIGGDGNLRVFLDDYANAGNTVNRTTYDGIGYSAVPEPATAALTGLGLALLIAARRRVKA